MNKYTLFFLNKSLEEEYFNKVAFPHYNQIFSSWSKILIAISFPCSLFTYLTGNLQYLGFIWCIISTTISFFIVKYKKKSFNVVVAIYNVGFVVLNSGFILITNKNIGAEGQQNNMMFIFAGSQYIFHQILSMGSNFILNSVVIFVQNFAYSVVFFPGQLNSFHGLLFFAMCFMIWTKYTNEKRQRDVFILQENEKEWSSFVRDVLPSNVVMVKYNTSLDIIEKKLVNRASQQDYNIKDDESLKQFLRNTIIQKEREQNIVTSITGESIIRNSIGFKGQRVSIQNGYSDTLERFIYYKFKDMIQQSVSKNQGQQKKKTENKDEINIQENQSSQSPVIKGRKNYSIRDSAYLSNADILPNSPLQKQAKVMLLNLVNNNNQSDNSPGSSSNAIMIKDKSMVGKTLKSTLFNTKDDKKQEKEQQNQQSSPQQQQTQTQQEQYKVDEYKAIILKNNVKVEVIIKIVFYHLSYPVCSICIDEGLKQQVANIGKQSRQKEAIYLQHFLKIAQKFQKVIQIKDANLMMSHNLLNLNHLRNVQDLVQLKQDLKLKITYASFQLASLLKYISTIFTPVLKELQISFSIQICHQYQKGGEQAQSLKKGNQIISDNEVNYDKNQLISLLPSQNQERLNLTDKIYPCFQKKSIQDFDKIELNSQSNQYCTQYEKYDQLHEYKDNITIYNDQQKISQVIINLLDNATNYLSSKSNVSEKKIDLFVKVIHGSDDFSNLIDFKVSNNAPLGYDKQPIYLIKDSLRVESELQNNNIFVQCATSLKPTSIGLRLNQKILEKTSPYNYMDIGCEEHSIYFSFLIYSHCGILLQDFNKNFSNKTFDKIRDQQIEQSYLPQIFLNTTHLNGVQENVEIEKSTVISEMNKQDSTQGRNFNNQQIDITDKNSDDKNQDENFLECITENGSIDENADNKNKIVVSEFQDIYMNKISIKN